MKTVTFLRHYAGVVTGSQSYTLGQVATLADSVADVLLAKGVVVVGDGPELPATPPLETGVAVSSSTATPAVTPARKPASKRAVKKAAK